jgi:hypothetical protein
VNWREIASYIMNNEKDNQKIVVFRSNMILTLSHYYNGKNQICGLPKTPQFTDYNLHSHQIKDLSQIKNFMKEKILPYNKFWLVVYGTKPYRNVDINYDILSKYIHNFCYVLKYHQVQEAKIFLLRFHLE